LWIRLSLQPERKRKDRKERKIKLERKRKTRRKRQPTVPSPLVRRHREQFQELRRTTLDRRTPTIPACSEVDNQAFLLMRQWDLELEEECPLLSEEALGATEDTSHSHQLPNRSLGKVNGPPPSTEDTLLLLQVEEVGGC
jgi:hypothetical protein